MKLFHFDDDHSILDQVKIRAARKGVVLVQCDNLNDGLNAIAEQANAGDVVLSDLHFGEPIEKHQEGYVLAREGRKKGLDVTIGSDTMSPSQKIDGVDVISKQDAIKKVFSRL